VTTLQGATDEQSSLHIRATAKVEVLEPCELALLLQDVTLEESDPLDGSRRVISPNSDAFKRALETRPLRFSFQDGRVQELCTTTEESEWVLNLKRGVLSAFQNSMEHFSADHTVQETDVAGNCDADYKISNKGFRSVTITKSKNLLGCANRNKHFTALQSTPYRVASDIQSLPLMKSTHNCVQTISNGGILTSSECQESHVFRPFSNQDNGAMTSTKQKLEYQTHLRLTPSGNIPTNRRTSLLFDHSEDKQGSSSSRAEETLREMCASDDVRPETPRLFSELVYRLRDLDYANLKSLHRKVHGGRVCDNADKASKFLHDAIPMVGSTASVLLIRDLVGSGRVTGVEADMWLSSLPFISEATYQMVEALKSLMASKKDDQQVMLSSSALVNTYCRQNDCQNDNLIQDIVGMLTANLGHHCRSSNFAEWKQMLISLKALRNIGVAGEVVPVLNRCMADKDNSIEVRLAAIDAHRSMPCNGMRREMLEVFASTEEDAEVRIAAYLGAMQCPCTTTLSKVKEILGAEEVNQVGSFVWTHLTNLMETSDPFKKDIRDILEDDLLAKEFNLDQRKFSRNYEGAVFFNSINTGAKMESNLIWSSKSYIPRSAMMNLTVDMFGHSVNLLEFGGRVEGMEKLLESLFGPDGYFPDNPVSSALKRQKRAAFKPQKLNRLQDTFDANVENSPKGSMYMKMFGNELRFLEWDAADFNRFNKDNLNVLELMLQLARDNKVEMSKSFQFLDTTINIPTIIGVPLKLSVNGTATVNLEIAGKVDMRQAPRTIDVDGSIKPSGAVEVSSVMSMDAFMASTGLKMVSTLHSSTQLDTQVQLQDYQVLSAKFNMPRDKLEIIDVQNKFFIVHGDAEREQQMITEEHVEKTVCTGKTLEKTLGLQLCGQLSYPRATADSAPYFPFTGPANFKVTLNKRDTHTSYDFEARLQTVKDRQADDSVAITNVARLAFNTPGSAIDRDFLVDFVLDRSKKSVTANFRCPWKKLALNGNFQNDPSQKGLTMSVMMDESMEFSLMSSMLIESSATERKYSPTLEVRIPGRKPMSVTGALTYNPSEMITGQLTMENVVREPVTLKGTISKDSKRNMDSYNANMVMRSPWLTVKANGGVDSKSGLQKSSMALTYSYGTTKHRMSFDGRLKSGGNRYLATSEMTMSQFDDYNTQMEVNLLNKEGQLINSVELRYGRDFKDDQKKILITHETNYEMESGEFKLDQTAGLTYKAMDIQMDGKLNHRHNMNEVKTQAVATYRPGKKVNFDMHLKRDVSALLKMNADLSLSYPGREMHWQESLEQIEAGYHHELIVQWQRNAQFQTVGDLKMYDGDTYDLRAEFNPPRYQTIVVSANTKLRLDDFLAALKVDRAADTYSASMAYSYDHMRSARANLELKHPQRRVVGDASMTKEGNEYKTNVEVSWDADNDSQKKFAVDGTFRRQGAIVEGFMKMLHPQRKLSMAFNKQRNGDDYTSHAELSWDTGKTVAVDTTFTAQNTRYGGKLNGNMKFTSPFTNLENLLAEVSYKSNRRQNTGKLGFTWAEGKTIEGQLDIQKENGWMNTENKLTVTTPFANYEEMSATMMYNIQDNQITTQMKAVKGAQRIIFSLSGKDDKSYEKRNMAATVELLTPFTNVRSAGFAANLEIERSLLSAHVEGELENKKIALEVSGRNAVTQDNKHFEGRIQLKTPFTNFEELSLEGRHSDDKQQYTTSAEARWAADKAIAVEFDMLHTGYGLKFNNHGKLQLTTPFKVERIALDWTEDLSDNGLNSVNELSWNDKKMSLAVQSQFVAVKEIQTSVNINTPYEVAEDISLDVLLGAGEIMKANIKMSRKNIEEFVFDTEVNVNTDINGRASLSSSLLGLGEMSTVVSATISRMPYDIHTEVNWNNKKVAIDGELSTRGWQYINGKLQFISPFNGIEKLEFNADHSKTGSEWRTQADFAYAADKKIDLAVTLNDDLKKGSISLQSPCSYIKSLLTSWTHKGTGRKFNNVFSAKYDSLFGMTSFDSSVKVDSIEDVDVSLRLLSPIEALKDVKLNVDHKERRGDWFTAVSCEFMPGKEVNLETRFSGENAKKAVISLKTPFRAFKKFELDAEHSGGLTTFVNRVDMKMMMSGKKTEFNSNYNVQGVKSLDGQMKLNIPVKGMEELIFNVNHNLDNNNLDCRADFTYGVNKKMEASLSLQTTSGISARIALSTPFEKMQAFTVTVEHKGSLYTNSINTEANIKLTSNNADTSLDASLVLNMNEVPLINGRVEFASPMEGLENIIITVNHGQQASEWVSSIGYSYAISKKIEAALRVDIPANQVTLLFKSPFTGFEHIKVVGSHMADSGLVNTQLEAEHNADKYNVRSTLDLRQKLTYDFAVETPFEMARSIIGNFEHSGVLTNFRTSAALDYNRFAGRVSSGISFNAREGAVDANLNFNSPFVGYQNIRAIFEHKTQGTRRYTTSVMVDCDRKVTQLNSQLSLQSLNDLEGQITFASPFNSARTFNLMFNHEGTLNQFTSHMDFKLNDMDKTAVDASFSSQSGIRGSFQLESPFEPLRRISLTVSHAGYVKNFQNQIEMDYAIGKRIRFTSSFSCEREIDIQAQLSTPFTQDITLSVKHQGDLVNFQHVSDLKYGINKNVYINGNMNIGDEISGQITLRTPFSCLESLEIEMKHEGGLSAFKNDIMVAYNGQVAEYQGQFTSGDEIDGKFHLKSPFSYIEDVALEFHHQGVPTNFQTSATLRCQRTGTSQMNMVFSAMNGITGEFSLQTPFTNFENINLEVNHKGSLSAFTSKAVFSYQPTKVIKVNAEFSTNNGVIGKFSLITPFTENIVLEFNHEGSLLSFTSSALFSYMPSKSINVNAEFNANDDITGQFTLETPCQYVEKIHLVFRHEKKQRGFNSMAKLNYQPDKTIYVEAEYNSGRNGNVLIKTPFTFMKQAAASFTHKENRRSQKVNVDLTFNDASLIDFKGDLILKPKIEGDFSLKTPISGMELVSVVFSHEGDNAGYTSMASVSRNSDKIEVDAVIRLSPSIEANINLKTPFTTFESIAMTLTHENSRTDISLTKNAQTIQADVTLKTYPAIEATMNVRTPFENYEHLAASATHKGTYRAFESSAYVMKNNVRFDADLSFRTSPTIEATVSVHTPFVNFEHLAASMSHRGDSRSFTSAASVMKNNVKFEGDVSVKMSPTIEASVNLETPIAGFERLTASISHDGDTRAFSSKVSVAKNSDKIDLDIAFKNVPELEVAINLRTPVPNFEHLAASVSHEMRAHSFVSKASVMRNNDKLEGDVAVTMYPSISCQANVRTPFTNFEHMGTSFTLKKEQGGFTTDLAMNRNNDELSADVALKMYPHIEGSASLKTPVTGIENLAATVYHEGDLNAFSSRVVVMKNDDKLQADVSLKTSPSLEGSFNLLTPFTNFEDIAASFSHKFEAGIISSNALLRKNNDRMQADLSLKITPAIDGRFTMQTPFTHVHDVTIEVKHDGSWSQFSNNLKVSIDDENLLWTADFRAVDDIATAITLQTPFEMARHSSASFNFVGNLEDFTSNAQMSNNIIGAVKYNGAFSMVPSINGNFRLETPLAQLKDMSIIFSHDGDMKNFQTRGKISNDGYFTMQSEANLKTSPIVEGFFQFKSDIECIKDTVFAFNHQGNMMQFRSHLEAAYGAHNAQFDADLKTSPVVNGNVKVQTTLPGFESMRMSLNHEGNIDDFKSNLEIAYTTEKIIKTNVALKTSPYIEGSISMETPCPVFQNALFTLRHDGDLAKFNTDSELRFNGESLMKMEAELDTISVMEGSFKLKSKIPYVDDLYLQAKHEGNLAKFQSQGQFVYQGSKSFNTDVTFQTSPNVEGSVRFQTSLPQIRDAEAKFTHNGMITNFRTEMTLTHNGRTMVDAETVFKANTNVEGGLTIKTPVKDVSLQFNHRGELKAFQCQAILTIGQDTFQGDIASRMEPHIEISVSAKTPFAKYNNIESGIRLNIDEKTIHYELTVDGQETKFEASIQKRPFTLQAKFTSPLEAVREISLEVNHRGSKKAIQSRVEINHNGKPKFQLDVDMRNYARKTGSITMKTPFKNMEDMSFSYRHKMENEGLLTHAEFAYAPSKVIIGDLDFTMNPKVAGEVRLQTPFTSFEDLSAKASFDKTQTGVSAMLQSSYAPSKAIMASMNLKTQGKIEGDMQFKSPFQNMESLEANFALEKSISDANGKIEIYLAPTKVISLETTLKTGPSIEGQLHFASPFTQNVATSFRYQKEDANIAANAEASYGSKTVSTNMNLNSHPNIEGHWSFTSPFAGYENLHAALRHVSSTGSMNTHIEGTYAHGRMVSGDLVYSFSPIKGLLRVQTPYSDQSIRFNHQTKRNGISSSVEMQCSDKTIQGNLEFAKTRRSLDASLNIKTPFQNFENVGADVRHETTGDGMTGSASVRYNTNKAISVEGSYTPSRTTASMNTPFRGFERMTLDMSQTQNGPRYEPRGTFTWGNKQIEASGSYSHSGPWSRKVMDGRIEITTPFRILSHFALDGEHSHSSDSLVSRWNADLNRQKVLDVAAQYAHVTGTHSGSLNLKTPSPTSIEFNVNGQPDGFSGMVSLNKDNKDVVRVEVAHKLETARSSSKRTANLKVITPTRTTAFNTLFDRNGKNLLHSSELSWREDKKIAYDLGFTDNSNYQKSAFDLRCRLDTPIRSLAVSCRHNAEDQAIDNGFNLMWDAARDPSKKIDIRNHFEHADNYYKNELTLDLPKMQKDIILRHELTLHKNGLTFSGRQELEYSTDARENLVMSARLQDLSRGSDSNYSVEFGLSHPRSQIDIQMTSHVANGDAAMSAGMEMNYLTARRQMTNMRMRGEIEKLRKRMNMELLTPEKSFQLNGKLNGKTNAYSVNLVATEDRTKQVRAEMDVDTAAQTMDVKAYYTPDNPHNVLHVVGKMAEPQSLSFDAYRLHNDDRFTETQLAVDVKDGRLLHSRLYWRPSMYQDIKEKSKQVVRDIKSSLASGWSMISSAVSQEVADRLSAGSVDMRPLVAYIQDEITSFQSDVSVISSEWQRMYQANEFYLRDVVDVSCKIASTVSAKVSVFSQAVYEKMEIAAMWLQDSLQGMKQIVQGFCYFLAATIDATMDKIVTFCTEICDVITACIQEIYVELQAKFEEFMTVAGEKAVEYAEKLVLAMEPYVEAYIRYYNHFWRWYDETSAKVAIYLEKIRIEIVSHPAYHKMMARLEGLLYNAGEYYEGISLKVHDWRAAAVNYLQGIDFNALSDLHVTVTDNIKDGAHLMNTHAQRLVRKYNRAVDSFSQTVNGHVQYVIEHEHSQYLQKLAMKSYAKVEQMMADLQLAEKTRYLFDSVLTDSVTFLKKNSLYLVKDYLHLDSDRLITFNPREGQIEFQLYVPVDLPELQKISFMDVNGWVDDLKDKAMSYVPDFDYSIWDTYYKYKPSSDVSNWLPPFKAYAAIGGRQHYMTFDKTYYEFAGPCSYVLASDMVNKYFSVVVNYNGNRRGVTSKSLLVLVDGKQVEILSSYKVTVDGASTELPVEFGSTTVRRHGNQVRVDNEKGFTVSCDMETDVCGVDVAGWYYGKMAGMLGTYDNEPRNDMMPADSKTPTDLQTFAASWEVSNSCPTTNNVARTWETSPDRPSFKVCKALFQNKTSPLRPCFKVVDPAPFMKMCINDVEADVDSVGDKRAVCKAAAMYVHVCRKEEVEVHMPKHCIRCEKPGFGYYEAGETIDIGSEIPAPQSTDIVFVVEEKPCNQEVVNHISNMAIKMELMSLRNKGLRNNQFGLIGFGGTGVHDVAHTHTVDGQLFNDARKFQEAANSLVFTSEGVRGRAMDAIQMAAQYPFRTGVAKSIVLVTCDTCAKSSVSMRDLEAMLRMRGITLHVLREHQLQVQDNEGSPSSSFLFGVDSETAYTSDHVSDEQLNGDRDLFNRVISPDDSCSTLAHKTGGTFFDLSRLTGGRVSVQKRFVDVFVRRVAKSATPAPCQTCRCEQDELGVAMSVCTPCPSKTEPVIIVPVSQKEETQISSDMQTVIRDEQ